MSFRPTPFGLFSGISWGKFADSTQLEFSSPEFFKKKVRLDSELLLDIVHTLNQSPIIRSRIRFFLNDTVYVTKNDIRFIQYVSGSGGRKYSLARVANTEHVFKVMERAKSGARMSDLVDILVSPGITHAEAEQFADSLVDEGILISELEPRLTEADPLNRIIQLSEAIEVPVETIKFLKNIRAQLDQLTGSKVGTPIKYYTQIAETVKKWDDAIIDADTAVVQVDLFKSMNSAQLNKSIVGDLRTATEVLYQLMPVSVNKNLEQFQREFLSRYGTQEIPLLEALDPSIGIGYLTDKIILPESPDIDDLTAVGEEKADFAEEWHKILNETLIEHIQNETPLELKNIPKTFSLSADRPATSFFVACNLLASDTAQVDAGNYQLVYEGSYGPGSALMVNRFGYCDNGLQQQMMQMIAQEEAMNPDVIFAEIVHLPQPHFGNFLQRLPSYQFEIPVLSGSSKPENQIIPLQDLMVSVRSGKLVLTSFRYKKEVIPRLTTAHSFKKSDVPHYVFLCDLQRQHAKWPLRWNWGHFSGLSYLPRVVYGNVIFSKARWRLHENSISGDRMENKDIVRHIRTLALQKKLPVLVTLSEGDNKLLLNLEDDRCCELLYRQIKKKGKVLLEESLFNTDNLVLKGSEGGITNEILVPFITDRHPRPAPVNPERFQNTGIPRNFIPYSEWLYIKLYCDIESADVILIQAIAPLAEKFLNTQKIKKWFYIRYNDPEFHLKIRFNVCEGFHHDLLTNFNEAIHALLDEKIIWKIQYDTYSRELERYGECNIENSENIFCCDSTYGTSLLRLIGGDDRFRFNVVLVSVDRYLMAFGMDVNERDSFVTDLREQYADRFFSGDENVKKTLLKSWSQAFQKKKKMVQEIFSESSDDPLIRSIHVILNERNAAVTPFIQHIDELYNNRSLDVPREKLVSSYIHMHINRMLQYKHRIQEITVYDFLHLHYRTVALNLRGYPFPSSN
jgi:thiopeptide-type bacteriocin biosynthesis protein